MKKILIGIIAITSILLTGCFINDSSGNKIYKVGREFNYNVSYYDSVGNTTNIQPLNLKVTDGFYIGITQTKIVWSLIEISGKDTTWHESHTGVIDNDKRVWIHPPRIGDLTFTSYAEFPGINPSLKVGKTATSTGKINFPSDRKLNGITITSVITESQITTGTKDITLPAGTFKNCRIIKTTGISELGTVYGDYYFHPDYGFVYWEYNTPWGLKVTIELTEVNF